MGKIVDIIWKKYWKLNVIKFAHIKNRHAYWECKCDCGNIKIICWWSLVNWLTKTCWCWRNNKPNYKHWLSWTEFYSKRTWIKSNGMKSVWLWFSEFMNDMYESYVEYKKHSINKKLRLHRINKTKCYSKNNCIWYC